MFEEKKAFSVKEFKRANSEYIENLTDEEIKVYNRMVYAEMLDRGIVSSKYE